MEKKTVQAVYEDGVLRPLEPVPLGNRQEVTVTASNEVDIPRDHQLVVSPDERADAAGVSSAWMRSGVRWLPSGVRYPKQ